MLVIKKTTQKEQHFKNQNKASEKKHILLERLQLLFSNLLHVPNYNSLKYSLYNI